MTQKQPPYQKENQTFEAQMSDQWLRYLLAAILLITCLIYFKVSGFDFLFSWDDNGYITNNEHIKNLTWGISD
ncbi:hypothetical protein EMGBS15_04870 [Filimonas sp.]|nr:hypothetical protein EMGBS15_04870 [Filimonas sp.]